MTYGNGFQNGYRGRDLSATGVGMKFDFIIVHESGHEWFGNNISMKDAADMWIHESFTNYSENLFVEYHFTEEGSPRLRDRLPQADSQRPPDHRHLRRQQFGLGRHVLQGWQHAAHAASHDQRR